MITLFKMQSLLRSQKSADINDPSFLSSEASRRLGNVCCWWVPVRSGLSESNLRTVDRLTILCCPSVIRLCVERH